jgi:hypothetical protein
MQWHDELREYPETRHTQTQDAQLEIAAARPPESGSLDSIPRMQPTASPMVPEETRVALTTLYEQPIIPAESHEPHALSDATPPAFVFNFWPDLPAAPAPTQEPWEEAWEHRRRVNTLLAEQRGEALWNE